RKAGRSNLTGRFMVVGPRVLTRSLTKDLPIVYLITLIMSRAVFRFCGHGCLPRAGGYIWGGSRNPGCGSAFDSAPPPFFHLFEQVEHERIVGVVHGAEGEVWLIGDALSLKQGDQAGGVRVWLWPGWPDPS